MFTVLVVDDHSIIRRFLVKVLSSAGIRPLEASGGQEALALMRAEKPDVVISDILMPTMDGYEFVQRLRADSALAATPVIFHTATYDAPEARKLAEACGVSKLLPKPCEPQELLDAINEVSGANIKSAGKPLPAFGPGARSSQRLGSTFAVYAGSLHAARLRLDKVIDGIQSVWERQALRNVSAIVAEQLAHLRNLGGRMHQLIELGLDMGSQRDASLAIQQLFDVARQFISADYVALGLPSATNPEQRLGLGHGVSTRWYTDGKADAPLPPLLAPVVANRSSLRRASAEALPASGLPPGHPPVGHFLAVPLASRHEVNGWMYFAKAPGGSAFSEEDEHVAATLCAGGAMFYEKAALYELIQRHAARLQLEVTERQRAEAAARAAELDYRSLFENAVEGIYRVDAEGRVLMANPALALMLGYDCAEQMVDDMGKVSREVYLRPTDRSRYRKHLAEHGVVKGFETQWKRRNGSAIWVSLSARKLQDPASGAITYLGMAEDITQRKVHEVRIAKLARMQAVLSGINNLIVRVRSRAELFQEACRIAVEEGGFRLAWIALLRNEEAVPVAHFGSDAGIVQKLAISTRPGGPNSAGPTSRALRENRPCVVNDIVASLETASHLITAAQKLGARAFMAHPLTVKGHVVGCLGLYAAEQGFFDEHELPLLGELARDISYAMEFILREEQLDHLAVYDPLTQLPNRSLFLQRLHGFVQTASESTTRFAVLMLDVERFKAFNDALGHAGGDELMKQIAERLKYLAGGSSFVARIVGDRFAVVVPQIAVDADIDAVVWTKDWSGLGDPIQIGGLEVHASLKVGAAVFPEDAAEPEGLLRNAELALKQGRSAGRRYTRYKRDMAASSAQALNLEARLRRALKRRDFVLHYQPKVDLRTGAVCGAEALIRWQDDDQLVPPSVFIPLLEETGLILDVGHWVLEQAATDSKAWARAGLSPPRVSVNVSQAQLAQPHFVTDVLAILAERSRAGADIEIELTESMLMSDVEAGTAKLRQLRDAGISVVMDDFGTGYSSLAYLARLPLNAVKIDRSFIRRMTEGGDTLTVAAAISSMAHSMNLRVVAEGVETAEQLGILRNLQCDEMQGALFSMPVPAAEFAELLRTGRTLGQVSDEVRRA